MLTILSTFKNANYFDKKNYHTLSLFTPIEIDNMKYKTFIVILQNLNINNES